MVKNLAHEEAPEFGESFNSRVRDELVDREEFASVLEARVLARAGRQDYDHVRPHSSLGYRTPAEFAASCPRADSAALRRPEGTTVVTKATTLTAPGT
jgi:putative transposase